MDKKAVFCSIFFFSGLVLAGFGLFTWFGLGPALTASGVVLVSVAIAGAVR